MYFGSLYSCWMVALIRNPDAFASPRLCHLGTLGCDRSLHLGALGHPIEVHDPCLPPACLGWPIIYIKKQKQTFMLLPLHLPRDAGPCDSPTIHINLLSIVCHQPRVTAPLSTWICSHDFLTIFMIFHDFRDFSWFS